MMNIKLVQSHTYTRPL